MKSVKTRANKNTNLAIFSGSLLVAASSLLLFAPVIKTNAAEESVDVTVTVNPVVSLSLDKSALNFNITPTSAGVFDSGSIVAIVDTNSTGGYELYFSSEDSSTSMTNLVSESTIASDFNSAVTSTTMLANKWGYSLDATNYNKIPALADQVTLKNLLHLPTVAEKTTTVTIGTKIDSTLPSGTYSKKVVFSAIAHPNPNINKLVDLTSMQDSNLAQYCADTYTPTKNATDIDWDKYFFEDLVPRASVKDNRDDKYYLISKLADGNCWMSQNLELMLDSTKTLTNEDTDLNTKTSWRPENSTLTEIPTTGTWPTSYSISASAAYSYYPIASERYYQGGFVKSSTPTASGVEYDWEKAGIYYNWFSATAGSGIYLKKEGTAEDSICPKGWMLPSATTEDKSFYNLVFTKYGGSHSSDTAQALRRNPFNFLSAGYYNHAGHMTYGSGYIWSSTYYVSSELIAHSMLFYGSDVEPQSYYPKNEGISVRCVAR